MTSDEQIILSAIAQGQMDDLMQTGVFKWSFAEPYATLFRAAQSLRLRGQIVSLLSLSAECSLSDWGPFREIFREAKASPKIDWRPAAERIARHNFKALGQGVATDLLEKLSLSSDPRLSLQTATTQLTTLIDQGRTYNPTPSHHYQNGVMGELTVSTGLKAIDKLLGGGLWTQALVIVALPSNHGKSTLAYTLLAHAIRKGQKCVLFTFETQTATATARVLSALTGVNYGAVLSRKAEGDDIERLKLGLEIVDHYLRIYDYSFNSIPKMEAVVALERPALAIVDHLGMVDPASAPKNTSRFDQIGDVADASLQWTIKYCATILVNSQLSNEVSLLLKKNHDLEHTKLFGSSRVYNAADIVILGLRHWQQAGTTYLRNKKSRKDGIVDFDVLVKHDPFTQSYTDVE